MLNTFRLAVEPRLSHLAAWKPFQWTVAGTFWCVFVSWGYQNLVVSGLGGTWLRPGLATGIMMAVVLAGPILGFLAFKLRELAIANKHLGVVASTDSLTACLNRGSFHEKIDEQLGEATRASRPLKGALLIIDADHFKTINDTYGHDEGDEALRIIAAQIRGQVRKGDLVGRLGGEEFGVFLPGASQENALAVAERVRRAISDMSFRPRGVRHPLSVSVGGVSFEDQLGFVELYRIADRRLYQAKNGGRNRIELTHIQAYSSSDAAPLH
ncbi:MAG: GGDEF domain-containing protein [Algoriphagus sp.]|nr:GGDEF domain-containing protein [Algoriphagus sp.]